MNFYIYTSDNKTKKLSSGEFYAKLNKEIAAAGIRFDSSSTPGAVNLILKKEPIDNLNDETQKAVDIIRSLVEASVEIEAHIDRLKQSEAQVKAQAHEEMIREQQEALQKGTELATVIESDTNVAITSRLAQVIGENFTVTRSGGLIVKKGARPSVGDVLTAIQGTAALASAGDSMASKCKMALVDALDIADRQFGEEIYSQLLDEDFHPSTMKAALMVKNHFPVSKREEIDPEGKLGFTHWQELSANAKLTKPQKARLAKVAATKGATKAQIREMASNLSKVDEDDRGAMLSLVEAEDAVDDAIETVKQHLHSKGVEVERDRKWLFITIRHSNGAMVDIPAGCYIDMKTSNGWNMELQKELHQAVRLGTHPEATLDGENLSRIDFVYTSPTGKTQEEEKPAFADIRVFEKDGVIKACGTIDGKKEDIEIEEAKTVADGLSLIRSSMGLDKNDKDSKGNQWNLRQN